MQKHESMNRCKFCVTDTEAQMLQPWVVHYLWIKRFARTFFFSYV